MSVSALSKGTHYWFDQVHFQFHQTAKTYFLQHIQEWNKHKEVAELQKLLEHSKNTEL